MATIVFDMFGVIARMQSDAGKARIAEAVGLPDDQRFWHTYWKHRGDYDAARVDIAGFWNAMTTELGKPLDPAKLQEVEDADMASWAAFDPEMIDLLYRLRDAGHRLALLSNLPTELAEYHAKETFFEVFDVVGQSCKIGVEKPDPRAFEWVAGQLGTPMDQILFTDDTQENIDAAAALGIVTHRFVGREDLEAWLAEQFAAPA